MEDKYGRIIDYMRISVTEKCNYRCFYCMPQETEQEKKQEKLLKVNEIISLARAGAKLGIKKIRITGGEPLIRKDIREILKGISQIEGVEELCITTNGSLVGEKIELLKEYKVNRINISLDTLCPEKFKKITMYGEFKKVWEGIEKAIRNKIEVRVNSVIIKGINDDEVEKLAKLTLQYPLDVRFIELMPIGEGKNYKGLSGSEIRSKISIEKKLENLEKREGASEYYKYPKGKGRIGFINPLSNCFCQECNRIRVTSVGEIKRCLNKRSKVDIRKVVKNIENSLEVSRVIEKEIYNKPEKHLFNEVNECEEKYNMNQIGG